MERHICPYCKKQTENNICEYCHNAYDEYSDEKKLMYDLKIAIINDDKRLIQKYASLLPKTNLIKYYIAYSNGEDCEYSEFTDQEIIEVGLHKKDLDFIKKHIKNKELINKEANFDIKLLDDIDIKFESKYKDDKGFGKALIYLSLIISGLFILLSLLIIPDIRLYYQTLLLIIPGTLLSIGIFKVIKIKPNRLFGILITLAFIITITYLINLSYNINFLIHIKKVLLSIYYLLEYYIKEG